MEKFLDYRSLIYIYILGHVVPLRHQNWIGSIETRCIPQTPVMYFSSANSKCMSCTVKAALHRHARVGEVARAGYIYAPGSHPIKDILWRKRSAPGFSSSSSRDVISQRTKKNISASALLKMILRQPRKSVVGLPSASNSVRLVRFGVPSKVVLALAFVSFAAFLLALVYYWFYLRSSIRRRPSSSTDDEESSV